MSFMDTIRLLRLRLNTEQLRACAYLERQGQRFCVEFGYGNAVEKAREHWRARRRAQQQKRRLRGEA